MQIPKQLKNKNIRFIKITEGAKRPSEKDWQGNQNYSFDDKKFQEYVKTASSCGILCGRKSNNLFVVDCDRKELASDILLNLPSTFTVQTGSKGFHFYFYIPDLDKKIVLIDNAGTHWGEVQGDGSQVLSPNSKHPNGNLYKVVHNNNIATITKSQLLEAIKSYRKKKKEFKSDKSSDFDLDISTVANTISGLDMTSEGLQGSHPIHGSTNGNNFCINLEKNVWFCHRHQIGSDTIGLIAMLEGLVKCEELVPGYFKNNPKIFKKTLKIAREKYGYDIPIKHDIVELFVGEKNNKLNVQGIVEYIMDNYSFVTIREPTGSKPHIYLYKDGYYHLGGEIELAKIIKQLFSNIPWKSLYTNEILEYIRTENMVDREKVNPPVHLINVANGIYNLKTNELIRHSSKYYFLYKLPVKYNPAAQMPQVSHYLTTTLKPQYIPLLQEVFGYTLYSNYFIAGIFYLYGIGGNGKSVALTLLTNLLGETNVSDVETSSFLRSQFASSCLYGKLANISGEMSAGTLSNTDTIKRISSGDRISAEFKGRDSFQFANKAKIITACNEIPRCDDETDGWFQRQYIIPFTEKFRNTKEDNTHLAEQLTSNEEEMEGLLLWAIEGLKRLLKNERFSYNYDMGERYLMYQQNSQYFVEMNYIPAGFDEFLEVDKIREQYHAWCVKNDVPEENDVSLARKLNKANFKLDKIRREDGKQVWIRRYIQQGSLYGN